MISLVEGMTVGGQVVTDTFSLVFRSGVDEATITVERMPITIRFDESVPGARRLQARNNDTGGMTFTITGSATGPMAFEANAFAVTDDLRFLSAAFFVDQVSSVRGYTRVVHCTITGRADG